MDMSRFKKLENEVNSDADKFMASRRTISGFHPLYGTTQGVEEVKRKRAQVGEVWSLQNGIYI